VIIPDDEPTVATEVLELVQVPVGALDSVTELPTQTCDVPDITDGSGCTVTIRVAKQPPGIVYVITVVPGAIPTTTPLVLTVAIVKVPELQVPPDVVFASVVEDPRQNSGTPVMVAGVGLTVTAALP